MTNLLLFLWDTVILLISIFWMVFLALGLWSGSSVKIGNFFTFETYPLKSFFKRVVKNDQEN